MENNFLRGGSSDLPRLDSRIPVIFAAALLLVSAVAPWGAHAQPVDPNSSIEAVPDSESSQVQTPATPDKLGGDELPVPPASFPAARSENEIYQERLVEGALKRNKLVLDPAPEGKKVEKILVVSYDVISEGDPYPKFVRIVHARTKPQIVRQEMLFQPGDPWQKTLVEETERNLLNNLFLSMAQVRPCVGSKPGEIIVLVVTKDLWSLRLNTDYSFADSKLELFSMEVVENNLGGGNRTLGAIFTRDLVANSFGLEAREPRLLGSRVDVEGTANLIINRDSSSIEGGHQSFSFGQPLYSLETEWAWRVSLDHRRDVYRLFSGGALALVNDPLTGDNLPYSFGRNLFQGSASVTRSFGREVKQDVSGGWILYTRHFANPILTLPTQPQSLVDFDNTVVPVDEQAGMLFARYHFHLPKYVRLEDISTFALAEDFQLGPDLVLEGHVAEPTFGFDSKFYEASAALYYRWYFNDDILTLGTTLSGRFQPDDPGGVNWVNEIGTVQLTNASPQFGIFRLHTQLQMIRRNRDQQRDVTTLGGDNLLRGYPSAFFIGPNSWATNFELRTRPAEFHTIYAGAALFADAGDAYTSGADAQLLASVGFGLRLVFPQFNRSVLRFDVGMPLVTGAGVSGASFVSQFGQAFD